MRRVCVCAVTPWNFPLAMAANKLLPSVITGNTVVVKPSPYTPLATVMLAEMAAEAFPPVHFRDRSPLAFLAFLASLRHSAVLTRGCPIGAGCDEHHDGR